MSRGQECEHDIGTNCRLYCWVLELHDFPDSRLKKDMKQKSIHSVM